MPLPSTKPGTNETAGKERHRKQTLRRLRWALTTGFFFILVALLWQPEVRRQFITSLTSLPIEVVLSVVALFMLMRISQAISFQSILRLSIRNLSFSESLALTGIKGLFNLGFAGLGVAAQAAQGKISHRIPVHVMIHANLVQLFLLIVSLSLGLTLAIALFPSASEIPGSTAFLFLGVGSVALGITGTAVVASSVGSIWLDRFPGIRHLRLDTAPIGWKAFRLLAQVALLQAIAVLTRVTRVLVIARSVSPNVDLPTLATSVLVADTVGVVPATPAGVGVRELLIGLLGSATEQYEIFLVAAVIDRVFAVVLNLFHGVLATWQSSPDGQESR